MPAIAARRRRPTTLPVDDRLLLPVNPTGEQSKEEGERRRLVCDAIQTAVGLLVRHRLDRVWNES
jgi:hypothetical protein